MKNVLLFCLLFIGVTACQKDADDPAPDPATRIAGTYNVTRLITDAPGTADDRNLTLPVTSNGATISATFDVTRVTETTVSILFTLRVTGKGNETETIGNFLDIRGNELYEGSTRIGTADGSTLNLDVTDDGTRAVFEARKQ